MSRMHVPKFNEIFFKSVELYKDNFKQLFVITLIASVIRELLQVASSNAGMQHLMEVAQKQGMEAVQTQIDSKVLLTLIFFGCLSGLVWLIAHALCVVMLNESWQGRKISWRSAMKLIWSCLVILIFSSLVAKFLIGFGLMFYMIPGLIIGTFFFVYIPVIIFENKSVFSGLKRSSILARGNFWLTLWMCFFTLILMIFPDLVGAVVRGQEAVSDVSVGMDEVVVIFLSATLMPFVAALVLTQYHALKSIYRNNRLEQEAQSETEKNR